MIFFSLFLGVQSAPEVGTTSYETPCILYKIWILREGNFPREILIYYS